MAFCFRQNEACFGGTIVEAEGGDAKTRSDLGVWENDGFEKSSSILAEGHAHEVGACFAAFGVAGLVPVAAHALGGSVGLENLEAVRGIPSGKRWSPLGERIFSGERLLVVGEGGFHDRFGSGADGFEEFEGGGGVSLSGGELAHAIAQEGNGVLGGESGGDIPGGLASGRALGE